MHLDNVIVGTRGSKLARQQTQTIVDALQTAHPDTTFQIEIVQTRGDATQAANIPLSSFGEKGIFAKELETALRDGQIDLAVHSMKDLTHTLPEGLAIGAVPTREDPRDALIGGTLETLKIGAKVGTGSVRRRALLHSRRPDLELHEIRGNIDSRLRKLAEGQYDAICLAVAGLNRLGLQENISEVLDPKWFTPDPGQGALAVQIRADDVRMREITRSVNDDLSYICVAAERDFLRAVGGSCQTPVGAYAQHTKSIYVSLAGMVAAPNGQTILRYTNLKDCGWRDAGLFVADKLREAGATALLEREH